MTSGATMPIDLSAADDDALAVLAPGRDPMRFGELRAEVERVARSLVERGVQPGDAVGLVGPDGPELAVLFLAISSVAAVAPLNPVLRRDELEFELADLGLRAVVVCSADRPHVVEDVARDAGVVVLRARPCPDQPAGHVDVVGPGLTHVPGSVPARFGPEVGLVLHTSGTTARPKIVPLSRANLAASAHNVATSLGLDPQDRGLVLMPLFHVHGLVAGLLAPLSVGSSAICTPGFVTPQVPRWWDELAPTWLTAVPTMHQALLDRLTAHPTEVPARPLRFLRSSSSSLAPQVMGRVEELFGAPLVEAYGMTEAAHQITVNPLPPGERRPGSVGLAAGPEVAVLGGDGQLLAPGEVGEIVIRGANVTAGYDRGPAAPAPQGEDVSASAFHDGWFRTDDQGCLDGAGYLTLTGRLKEIINRGGEKISPREIDEVLLDHPAIARAVTFAVPDVRLGEDVAAAVVAVPGASPAERDVREFVSLRLAPFKVPSRVVVLDELPTGATGKVQRIGMAERLGIADEGSSTAGADRPEHTGPRTEVEQFVAGLWAEVLLDDDVSVLDHFLDLGGDSMLATRLLGLVREQLDLEISMLDFFDRPTIAAQAELVEQLLVDAGD